jgi:DNA polymerase (family 10)
VHGIGPRRAHGLREVLGSLLRRRGRRPPHDATASPRPDVATLLELDARYRAGAAAGALPRIAPQRFNPSGEAWLPILHETRDGVHYTVLFSNTARAHRLGHTRDWVVIFHDHDGHEAQHTVVTEHQGPLRGKRVVRGLEAECAAHYRMHELRRAGG